MLSILVVSTKGGCGKTTVTTNLASAFSQAGFETALADVDPQQTSLDWGHMRPADAAPVTVLDWSRSMTKVPKETERLIIDAPAALPAKRVEEIVRRADVVLVPILPSRFDEHSTRGFLNKLEAMKMVRRGKRDVAIIANRVRTRNKTSRFLEDFLKEVDYPVVAHLSDTQIYPLAAADGLGLADLGHARAQEFLGEWDDLFDYLDEVAEEPASRTGLSLGNLAATLVNLRRPGSETRR